MNAKKTLLLIAAVFCIGHIKVYSQGDTATKQFALQAAIEYGLTHNYTYLNAENDTRLNTYKKNEVLGLWMPQINGSADLRDNLVLPTQLIPENALYPTAPAGQYLKAKFGVNYNLTASASVNQLIFSGDMLMAVRSSKEFINLSQKNLLRSKVETAQNIAKAYYGVLINRERIKILQINIDRVKILKDNATALYTNGFAEKIDADRLEVNYNNLVTEKEKTLRLVEVSELMLKFQMGYDLKKPIELSDNLDKIATGEELTSLGSTDKIDVSGRPEFMVLQSQQKLNELDLKRYRMQYLPSLSAYGLFAEQYQKNTLDFNKGNWFPFAYIGGTLNVPIFDGLQKHWRVQQAKVNLLKTQNSFSQLKQSIEVEVQSATANYKNALVSIQTQKRNIELARNVFEVTKKKFDQGIGSSLDLNTTENDLRAAETNYYNSLYDLIVAKIDYQKATGTLIK